MSDEEEVVENGHTKVTVDSSEADPAAPEGGKCTDGGGGGGRGDVCMGGTPSHASTPLREHSGSTSSSSAPSLPPRPDRVGRWPSLARIWNRRKSTGAATAAASAPDSFGGLREGAGVGRVAEAAAGGGGGQTGSNRTGAGRAMAGRTASAPAMVGSTTPPSSPSTRAGAGPGSLSSLDDLACTPVIETETLEELHPIGLATAAGDGAEETRAPGTPTATSGLGLFGDGLSESGVAAGEEEDEGGGRGEGARFLRPRSSSQGSITGPNPADVMSAPFLVARISGVGAELKDIMWSVKQTHFPYLKTAGSLQATLSGLTIELELDTQDLPAGGGTNRQGGGVKAHEGLSDGGNDSSGGGSGGEPAEGSPTGLKLTRLRVSVLAVKVHVKNNALSAVYNLAASAFEAAVKRYVVDNVEAAVRRNVTSLLTIVNTQLSQKWDVLCKVGGGGGGGGEGGGGGSGRGKGESPRAGSAVEKVLAASLSHHLVWPAGGEWQVRGGAGAAGGGAGPTGAKGGSLSDQRPTLERVASGSSRGSADSQDSGSGASSAATATSVKKSLAKRSFRFLGSVGKAQSTEELSKLSQSAAAVAASRQTTAPGSSSVPPPASRRASFVRPPPSPTPPSHNSSSTTLSEGETAVALPRQAPQAEWAGRWVQERREGEGAAEGFEKRVPSASPPPPNQQQPRGLGSVRDNGGGSEGGGGGGVFSDGKVGRRQDGGAGKYWKTSPTGSAVLRRSPDLSVPVVDG